MIFKLENKLLLFPDPELAEKDGLLAIGGDLSVERLQLAYSLGIFPWYSEDTPILWYSPHERFVLFPEKVKISKSMRKILESGTFRITENTAFKDVIKNCAAAKRKDQDGTWIIPEMQEAYIRLNKTGFAHSIEVWEDEELVGGLYGVKSGNVFCGESMFSRVSNASKAALTWLCQNKKYSLIDCQFHTPHLESMGAEFISRKEYMQILGPNSGSL
ncbi:leucyl/phenylalanyl-tRNA--protein transferase [Paradesertivirga mongoliensis]|uniref:Leucyl/phenylalanyl-tRNA--protein transferase n=1 Tax=Paradesertivirga mongoliensis TaxID=2100740 RepID=A0ABW4ZHY5_9SPHI